ncbi:hypothetical protein NM22_00685 [Vibrio tubiashii]|nr:hypothetical protein NM22_00685 [Vibrio tubiashii]
MKKTLIATAVATLSFSTIASVDYTQYNGNPNNPAVVTLENGAVANVASMAKIPPVSRMEGEISHETVRENVWFIWGDLYAPVVIETEEGLIVFSTGEHAGDGTRYREYIRENLSTKPVIAVMVDHNHYALGTRTLLDGDDAIIVAHPDMNDIMAARTGGGQANALIDEMQPHLESRARIHYGNHNPQSGPDAPLSPMSVVLGHESGFMPATHELDHGESITIGGLEIVAYHHITDTKDTLTFHIPEYDMIVDNVVWPSSNMYTLRGDAYRDPATWTNALKEIRDLEPEIVLTVGAGARALKGKENIRNHINAVMDARIYTYDQAIRLTNKGVPADQLKHYMPLPKSLMSNAYVNNAYGSFETFPEAFPTQNHGYFSGNPDDIHNLPKPVHASYMIKLAGGVEQTYKAWQQAMENGEYLWAKELSAALYYNAPANETARQAHADTLRKLAQHAESFIVRNFYVAGALSLEGDSSITLSGTPSKSWVCSETETAVNYLRTRLNPTKAEGKTGKLIFDVDGHQYGLEIRNSIAEFSTAPDYSDAAVIKVSAEQFSRYYVGELTASDIAKGQALELLNLFDEFQSIPLYPTSFNY